MLTTHTGDLLNYLAQIYVCPVNCVGVMGKGLALDFAQLYPQLLTQYREDCTNHLLLPGSITLYNLQNRYDQPTTIIAAATKDHWRDPSQYPWVEKCLHNIRHYLLTLSHPKNHPNPTVAIPYLGCGNGGLSKTKIYNLTIAALSDLLTPVVLIDLY